MQRCSNRFPISRKYRILKAPWRSATENESNAMASDCKPLTGLLLKDQLEQPALDSQEARVVQSDHATRTPVAYLLGSGVASATRLFRGFRAGFRRAQKQRRGCMLRAGGA